MKVGALAWVLSVLFFVGFVSADSSAPKMTIIGNSIDLPLVAGYIDNYRAAGVDVQTISAQDLPAHMNDSLILILGGQHAPEGVGGIVDGILTEREKADVLASWDAKVIAILPGIWTPKQKVMVFAGYGKEQTRKLFGEAQGDILKSLRFNDTALPVNVTIAPVPVPPLDGTQPFTEVNAFEANSIIQTIPGVVVIDVRGTPFYAAGHIPGAINLPEHSLEKTFSSLDPGKTYLLTCGGNSESIAAGNFLSAHGFKSLYRLVDGYIAWRRAGFPREKG